METQVIAKPDLPPIVRGKVLKTCGPLQRYASRTIELLSDGAIYIFLDGMSAPQSRIFLGGCTVADNSDAPNGFTILSASRDKKHKFICQDIDTKRIWLQYLHTAVNTGVGKAAAGNVLSPGSSKSSAGVSARYVAVDRSGEPLVEASLLKRSGISSYGVRWCEVWKGIGLAYAKFRTAPDDQFKLVPLEGARIVVNDEKMRITIHPRNGDDPTYLRMDNVEELKKWIRVLQLESGCDWEELSATVGEASLHDFPDKATEVAEESELDSDDELELADLESESPVRQHKVSAELDSVSRVVHADIDTPGFDRVLEKRLKSIGDYGFLEMLEQFEQKMSLPIYGPHSALHRHISVLDLDAQHIRKFLCELLDAYPKEVKLVVLAQRADALLLQFVKVREVCCVRRDIAEFREQRNQCGLTMGVNDTLAFIAILRRTRQANAATVDEIARAQTMVSCLKSCLHEFRCEYDVFDDAYFTIAEVEKGIIDGTEWVAAAERCTRERGI
jgi:hypothetical protein